MGFLARHFQYQEGTIGRIDKGEVVVSAVLIALGLFVGAGVGGMSESGGYSRIGPRFFPLLVAGGLIIVGAWLAWQAFTGGWRNRGTEDAASGFEEAASGTEEAASGFDARAFGYISAGVLAHMGLIAPLGFVPASTLLFVLVARGFGSGRLLRDFVVGLIVVGVLFAFFTQVLSVNLPVGSLFEAKR